VYYCTKADRADERRVIIGTASSRKIRKERDRMSRSYVQLCVCARACKYTRVRETRNFEITLAKDTKQKRTSVFYTGRTVAIYRTLCSNADICRRLKSSNDARYLVLVVYAVTR